jgi:hypothetical protein
MVSRSEIEPFRLATSELSRLVREALEAFFLSLDLTKPEETRDALLEFVPILVEQYGEVAATMAADWYEELRAVTAAAGRFTAVTAASVPAEAVQAQVRFLAGALWTPNPADMLGGLLTSADKYVKQPGRDTIMSNAKREGVRFARVPTGDKTCAFCLMLASRDAIYFSKVSAGDINDTGFGDGFHGDCDCLVVRIAKKSDYPEGYLPDAYYSMYMDARKAAGSGNTKDITAAARRLFPDALTDGVHTH